VFKINQIFTFKSLFLTLIIFFIISLSIYFSLSPTSSDSVEELREKFNILWISLTLVSTLFMLFIFFIFKNAKDKFSNDLKEYTQYVEKISNKDYKASVQIKHSHEILQLSILQKNIVKRVHHRDKKAGKK